MTKNSFSPTAIVRKTLNKFGLRLMRVRNCPQGTIARLYKDVAAFVREKSQPFIMLDIGANCGVFTQVFLSSMPDAVVHSFEPSPDVFKVLGTNVGEDGRVTLHNKAVGAEEGRMAFEVRPDDDTLGRLVGTAKAGTVPVEVTTVDAFLDKTDCAPFISVLKTDTEGHELQVLAGAARALARGQILSILVETTLGPATERHVNIGQLEALLSAHGFELFGVYDLGYDRHTGALRFCNALFKNKRVLP